MGVAVNFSSTFYWSFYEHFLFLDEGGDCSPEVPIAGAISDKVVCADGLICRQNICQKSCEGK